MTTFPSTANSKPPPVCHYCQHETPSFLHPLLPMGMLTMRKTPSSPPPPAANEDADNEETSSPPPPAVNEDSDFALEPYRYDGKKDFGQWKRLLDRKLNMYPEYESIWLDSIGYGAPAHQTIKNYTSRSFDIISPDDLYPPEATPALDEAEDEPPNAPADPGSFPGTPSLDMQHPELPTNDSTDLQDHLRYSIHQLLVTPGNFLPPAASTSWQLPAPAGPEPRLTTTVPPHSLMVYGQSPIMVASEKASLI
eukprot:gene7749-926_t